MSLDEMDEACKGKKDEGCPSEALHEDHCQGMVAFDDVTGQELDPALMMKARRDEMAYFRDMRVYEKVDLEECYRETGKAPIAVRGSTSIKGTLNTRCIDPGLWRRSSILERAPSCTPPRRPANA